MEPIIAARVHAHAIAVTVTIVDGRTMIETDDADRLSPQAGDAIDEMASRPDVIVGALCGHPRS